MSQKDVDSLKKGVEDALEWSKAQLTNAEQAFNDTADGVASNVREGLSWSLNQMAIARSQAEDVAETAQSHYKAFEFDALQVVRVNVKAGIAWAKEYPYAAYGVAGAGLLLFPGPRGFLFRNVFGAMQSQESAFRGASEKFSTLSETSTTLAESAKTQSEVASQALTELNQAKRAATAAHTDLSALSTRMSTALGQFEDVQARLRPLKHAEKHQLQADAARERQSLVNVHKEVNRVLSKLSSAGA